MAMIGYCRVSTDTQNLGLQLDALTKAGSDRIFQETASGAQRDRPELAKALDYLRPGDVLCVWKLDRLARSLRQLLETGEALAERGIGLRSLTESIDTTTPGGGWSSTSSVPWPSSSEASSASAHWLALRTPVAKVARAAGRVR